MSPQAAPEARDACVLLVRVATPPERTLPVGAAAGEPLAALLRAALASWPARERVVLQAEGGFAVVGETAPSIALEAACRLRAQSSDPPLAVALHRGPVSAARAPDGTVRVDGNALAVAAALAAGGSRLVASVAFRAALMAEAPRFAGGWLPLENEALRAHGAQGYDAELARQHGRRRMLGGLAGLVALVAAGYGGRIARQRYEEAHRPAVLLLDIEPSGEVFVDGQSRGSAPPLARLEVPPGPHRIEVRNPRARPLQLEVQLKPGQQMEIRHVFPAPPPRRAPAPPRQKQQSGPLGRFKFW